jgi:hypothetical protein
MYNNELFEKVGINFLMVFPNWSFWAYEAKAIIRQTKIAIIRK